ncbi:hypothetical protein J5491_04135 [Candidatus Saccharibacteria bacterium]|nr:hypothetical protein [Candidatus Saccharibacteria bacterium]
MLYTNKGLKVISREMKFGAVKGVAIGEYGRGRHEIFLPTPKSFKEEEEIKEFSPNLTIGKSQSGRPRIHAEKSDDLYLILSSERRYTRRGDGYIKAPKNQEIEMITRGNGADGAAGRIGSWDVVVVKATDGDVFRVTWGGSGYGIDATFYVVSGGKVYVADQPDVEDLYENLGVEAPFTLKYDEQEGRLVIDPEEWRVI